MDKLKVIQNAISENDFKKIDKLKDCLQKQLWKERSRDKSTNLISLISQLPQDELAHSLFPSDHFVLFFKQRNFSHTKVRWNSVSAAYKCIFKLIIGCIKSGSHIWQSSPNLPL